ncbi:MAG: citryl-CoA lyase [Deltaproteobacteria bacterium]|nr:citryl-CoA lyase [Deltaproteobacteria bacterium]
MTATKNRWGKVRNVGRYINEGKWDDYWRTGISHAIEKTCLIRGYPLEEIIENITYTETLYLTLRGELPTKEETRLLNAVLCSIPDHQFVASTAPAARFAASAFPDSPIPGIAAGILTMGSYTVSPQDSADFINASYELMVAKDLTIKEAAIDVVSECVKNKKRIPGFGHPTYRKVDPRSEALRKVAQESGFWGEKSQIYEAVHKEFVRVTGKEIPLNIDGMMACVLNEMGFDPLEMAGIAAVSYMCGIIAHVVEEIKEGVPLRIIPPEHGAVYTGPDERHIK